MTRLVKILRDAKRIYLSRFLTKFTLNHENQVCWPWQLIADTEGGHLQVIIVWLFRFQLALFTQIIKVTLLVNCLISVWIA